jgi:hypothetical protein
MLFIDILQIGILIGYLWVNIAWSQKVYSGGRFALLILISIIAACILLFFIPEKFKIQTFHLSMLFSYYFVLLLILKSSYKAINKFFIDKKLTPIEFAEKDFTYVHWNSMNPTSPAWWDEKLASKPSWFDRILTLLIITVPLLIMTMVYCIAKNNS